MDDPVRPQTLNEAQMADPEVLERLEDNELIRHRPLDLDQKVAKHFPGTI